jgi:hypothetical protein
VLQLVLADRKHDKYKAGPIDYYTTYRDNYEVGIGLYQPNQTSGSSYGQLIYLGGSRLCF